MLRKEVLTIGLYSYVIISILDISIGFYWLVIKPRIADWEVFSYVLYGMPFLYFVAYGVYFLFFSIIPSEKVKHYQILFVLLISVEISSLFFFQDFMLGMLIDALKERRYEDILVLYPVNTIIGFFVGRTLQSKFNKGS